MTIFPKRLHFISRHFQCLPSISLSARVYTRLHHFLEADYKGLLRCALNTPVLWFLGGELHRNLRCSEGYKDTVEWGVEKEAAAFDPSQRLLGESAISIFCLWGPAIHQAVLTQLKLLCLLLRTQTHPDLIHPVQEGKSELCAQRVGRTQGLQSFTFDCAGNGKLVADTEQGSDTAPFVFLIDQFCG